MKQFLEKWKEIKPNVMPHFVCDSAVTSVEEAKSLMDDCLITGSLSENNLPFLRFVSSNIQFYIINFQLEMY